MSTAAINLAYNIASCMSFAISMLVWPSSFVSLFALGWRAYREKQLIQSLPLLLSQLNTAFIWMCYACDIVGWFYYEITGEHLL